MTGMFENRDTMSIEIWNDGVLIGQCALISTEYEKQIFYRRFIQYTLPADIIKVFCGGKDIWKKEG